MKVAILGTRGIPNNYGGFEQCAEFLAKGLVERGFEVYVYNSHSHPFQEKTWNGVNIIHCYDPEDRVGTFGQFIYDLNCIRDSRKRYFDIILQLGYTSSSVWGPLLPKRTIVTTNMDGLEWKRTKFSRAVQRFLLEGERLAVQYSNFLIADSLGIRDYLKDKYNKEAAYIAYGAYAFDQSDPSVLSDYAVTPYQYNMLIARLEPENSIEVILDGASAATKKTPFIVVGKHETKYGEYLKDKYRQNEHIRFVGGIYNHQALNNVRHYSNLYFHGHTVGGTNPSLLEAMASSSLICANDNAFNKYVLQGDGFYFKTAEEVASAIDKVRKETGLYDSMIEANMAKIRSIFNWDYIIDQYAGHFVEIAGVKKEKLQMAI